MLRNRSGRLVAIMFAGSFVLAGAGGCIAGDDEAETDREATAGGESSGRDNTGDDGRSGGQTGGDRQSRAGGRQGGEQAGSQGGRQGGEQAGRQGGQQGGQQAGYQGGGGQRAGAEQACGEQGGRQGGGQAGYQGGRQGGGQAGYQGGQQGGGQAGYQGGSGQAGGHGAMRQVSDQEIATLVSLINQQEVQLSEIALEKAESPEVQRYAEEMIDEHSRAEQHGVRLSRGATTSIEACPQCQQLQADAVETSESLQEQEGAEFDAAFIWAQVSLHRRALEILDEPLVERTRDASLRSHVMQMRSDIEQHLRRAEQIFCTLLQARQQQSGQQQGAQQQGQPSSPQKSPQQQGQQSAQQQGQQQGQQSAQQQGQQSAQQQGQQSAQRGQQQGAQLQGQQQRGQQQGAQSQGQQQRGQQQGAQLQGQQQRGQQQGGQSQGQQSAQQRSQR
ncbi:DUF4142 domain-containing protein [Sorangium sp. So ce233]|uniref:DUF4142 domain-containing protein n=1 Tax=Sorangium sp. So ce233 TaxID=3133290 RepID=UPI003F5F5621